MTKARTYWHLQSLGRKPSVYEIATSRLHYYPARGFEIGTPADDWYRRYQRESPLHLDDVCDWEEFSDPRETTYATYVERQRAKEVFCAGLFASMEATGYDARLPARWVESLERVFAPLRYPIHGLQMIAAYVGQMAPSGRLTTAMLFQSADEVRRVQCIA